jgi:hypothetical protein
MTKLFIHSIRANNLDLFMEKVEGSQNDVNLNTFYIPETTLDLPRRDPTIPPRWTDSKKSILVAFDSERVVFQGGFPRNASSASIFPDARVENIPEKLHFIKQLKSRSKVIPLDSPRPIFSAKKYYQKIDGRGQKKIEGLFSTQEYSGGVKSLMHFLYLKHPKNMQFHDEAHIRGPLYSIKWVMLYEGNISIDGNLSEDAKEQIKSDTKDQLKSLLSLQQRINNKRRGILENQSKPENVKLLNNFSDIMILTGIVAMQKIAHLQKMLKYHELNPTIDSNEMDNFEETINLLKISITN